MNVQYFPKGHYMKASFKQLALLAALGACVATPVLAEPPMHVDDAGTLDKGGMKVEGVWAKDDQTRGGELVFGFAPVEDLEIGLAVARATDRADDPSTRLRGTGISFKWVPIQGKGDEGGWSLGASVGYGHTRVDERVTPVKFTEKESAFSALATYHFASAQVAHLNLGATRYKVPGESETLGTWGVGFEQPLVEHLKLTAEVFGEERSRPDKAIGLRYEVVEGFKISGAVGRGNDRSFGQVGFSWEF
jgi:hypothetical protein